MHKKQVGVNLLTFSGSELTGVGYFAKRLFEALPASEDIEFTFFCQESFELEKMIHLQNGVPWKRVNTPNFKARASRILYEQFILPFHCKKLEVLFSPCAANPLLKLNYRTITTIHDLVPFFVRDKYGIAQGTYIRAITRLLARFSDKVIVPSLNSKQDIIRVLQVNDSKIEVIYNFVSAKNTADISYQNFFLAVGTRQPGKNIPGIIRSFAAFCDKYDTMNHKLYIVGGSGWGNDPCTKLVADLNMQDRIIFTGYIPEEQLDELYKTCKGLIMLSFYEGFGIPILEALSWHKPSIASNASSMPEVMGSTGIPVDPRNPEQVAIAMKEVAENPTNYLSDIESQLLKFSADSQISAFKNMLYYNL